MFSLDLRALATLRIGVGLVILLDLYQRLPLFGFFYGDGGFLNRATNQVFCPPASGFWSVYWMVDQPWFVGLLMIVSAVAAIGMIFGFRSREMTALSLVLFWSLNVRNPLVTTAGHVLLRMFLFWMLFLPVGRVWSLDARFGKKPEAETETSRGHGVVSIATAALLIQFALMYFFSGIAKWNEVWFRGDALQLALQFNMYVKPFGHWLAGYPLVTMTATLLTLGFELIAPLMLFMPWGNRFWRVFFACALVGMHIGIWLTMSIGIFSWVAIIGWVLLMPSEFWSLSRRKGQASDREPKSCAADGSTAVWLKPRWANVIAAGFLVYVLAQNIANISPDRSSKWFPGIARAFGNVTMVVQEFEMFARPAEEEYWFEMRRVDAETHQHRGHVAGIDRGKSDIGNPDPERIYQSMRSNPHRRAAHALAVLQPQSEQEQILIADLRAQFARSWLTHLESLDQAEPLPENETYEFNCFRRGIDLDFPARARGETWFEGRLNRRP